MQIYISHAFFVGKFMAVICQSREYFVTEPAHNTRHRWTSDSSQTGNLPLSSFQITQRLRHGALHLRVTIALVSSALRSRNAYVMSLITFLKHIRSKLSWRSIIPLRLLFASTFSLFELSFFMLNHCRVSYYLKNHDSQRKTNTLILISNHTKIYNLKIHKLFFQKCVCKKTLFYFYFSSHNYVQLWVLGMSNFKRFGVPLIPRALLLRCCLQRSCKCDEKVMIVRLCTTESFQLERKKKKEEETVKKCRNAWHSCRCFCESILARLRFR